MAGPSTGMTSARAGITSARVALIGGAEDKTGPAQVLRHVLSLAAGDDPVVAVCGSASADPVERLETYREAFGRLGASVTDLNALDRDHAASPVLARRALEADVIFVTGGNQTTLVERIAGTPLSSAMLIAGARGAVLAGTSAGAAAATLTMISGGDPDGSQLSLARGLGWLPAAVVDQHFTERGRQGRLEVALATLGRPVTGIGVDEDTVAVVAPDRVDVVGTGTVTVVAPGAPAAVLRDGEGSSLRSRPALQPVVV